MQVASLPMYDLPELSAPHDALWADIRMRLGREDAPHSLLRTADPATVWNDQGLLLGQTCGYPLVTTLAGKVALLATPAYDAKGCDGTLYRSALVVRSNDRASCLADLAHRRCAINDPTSNSGMNVLRAMVAPLARGARFFGEIVVTGAHAASIEAVAQGRADIAAIDCVTWALLQRLRPDATAGLRVLDWSPATPGLPLITSLRTDAGTHDALLEALRDVSADPDLAAVRSALLLVGFARLPLDAYDAILRLERRAAALSYPTLR